MASAISAEVAVPQAVPADQPKLPGAWGGRQREEFTCSVSLTDVMNEELILAQGSEAVGGDAAAGWQLVPDLDPDTTSDEMLARLLQSEFDEELSTSPAAPEVIGRKGDSVDLGFEHFRQPKTGDESEDDDGCDWDTFSAGAQFTVGKQGFAKSKGKVLSTKHDALVCGRRNACRVMEFRSGLETGDGFDMKLNNNVYNALKVHSISEGKRMARLHEKKEKSTAESVMDEKSRLLIFKLINSGLVDEVNGAISTGKEANVYHGVGSNSEKQITNGEVAIKVYKTTLNEFKHRQPYIREDYRFKDKFAKSNNHKNILLWAEKEMQNLNRIRRAGLPCPQVLCLKKHVLVMEFIGAGGKPAPTLKEATLSSSQLLKAYDDTVDIMRKMYVKCDLVHADLSEFNLLWYLNKVWVIDVSQSVMPTHPNALAFLLRDCYNVTNFFGKMGVAGVKSACELFTQVSGKELEDKAGNLEILSQIDTLEREMRSWDSGSDWDAMFTAEAMRDVTQEEAGE